MNKKKFILTLNGGWFILSLVESFLLLGGTAYFFKNTPSLAMANLTASTFAAACFLAEIPTGYLSDKWGPKKSFLFSILLRAFSFGLIFLGQNSLFFLFAGNILAGISNTFMTGVFKAQVKLIEDKYNYSMDYKYITTQGLYFRNFGLFLGGILSYFVITLYGLSFIWIQGITFSFFLFFYILFFWENIRGIPQATPYLHLKHSLKIFFQNKKLKNIILFNASFYFLIEAFLQNWVIVFVPQLDKTPLKLALLAGSITFFRGGVAFLSNKIKSNRFFNLKIFLILTGIFLIGSALPWKPGAITAFFGTMALIIQVLIVIQKLILKEIPKNEAGTIASLESLTAEIGCVLGALCTAFLTNFFTIPSIWIFFGLATLFYGLFFYISKTESLDLT